MNICNFSKKISKNDLFDGDFLMSFCKKKFKIEHCAFVFQNKLYLNRQSVNCSLEIKEKYLVPPPNKKVDYNFSRKERTKLNGQANQPILIDEKIFKNRIKNGFFIEAGAYDGEALSNTLFFELKQRWTGLLIEPNPDAFELLKKKVRL